MKPCCTQPGQLASLRSAPPGWGINHLEQLRDSDSATCASHIVPSVPAFIYRAL